MSAVRTEQSEPVRWLEVQPEQDQQRLDNFLLYHLKGVPKSHLYRLIRSGQVRVNKKRSQASARLSAGDSVRVAPVRISEAVATPASIPAREFRILLEDESLIAIDKPAGLAVHGGSGVSFGVIEQIRRMRPEVPFLELVHRLDRETSGVLLLAKKRSALKNLQEQFRQRSTGKTYLALVNGLWPKRIQHINTPLQKYLLPSGERRVRPVRADEPSAMSASTEVRVRQEFSSILSASLLEVQIYTGRTHQIRVHLASQGHVILGDDKYGDFELNRRLSRSNLDRMFLHAWRLRFTHPSSGETVQLEADLPPDLSDFVNLLGLNSS